MQLKAQKAAKPSKMVKKSSEEQERPKTKAKTQNQHSLKSTTPNTLNASSAP
jgi:hypothetical protein